MENPFTTEVTGLGQSIMLWVPGCGQTDPSTGDVEHEGPQRSLHPDWSNWSTGEAEPNGIGDQFELRKDGRWHSSESRPGVSIICQFTPPSLPKGNI